eukprot:GCRY01002194.1.p1 GENE.GCRY01002194.1~~GCRY01002194.1.p1  ORF type:complete len:323 (+),score=33.15 GCRY01002194.1:42-971(+)
MADDYLLEAGNFFLNDNIISSLWHKYSHGRLSTKEDRGILFTGLIKKPFPSPARLEIDFIPVSKFSGPLSALNIDSVDFSKETWLVLVLEKENDSGSLHALTIPKPTLEQIQKGKSYREEQAKLLRRFEGATQYLERFFLGDDSGPCHPLALALFNTIKERAEADFSSKFCVYIEVNTLEPKLLIEKFGKSPNLEFEIKTVGDLTAMNVHPGLIDLVSTKYVTQKETVLVLKWELKDVPDFSIPPFLTYVVPFERKEKRHCSQCGEEEGGRKLGVCGGCQQRFFCGPDCQRKYWKAGHKQECKLLAKQK